MPKNRDELTAERLREILSYNPETGHFHWRVRAGRYKAGDMAGSLTKDGYIHICVNRVRYLAHRLAWLYVHGVWPADQLDHRSLVGSENWIDNLREATNAQNSQNKVKRSDNRSGYLGVYKEKGFERWRAEIVAFGRRTHLGRFSTPELASAAYLEAKARLHEFQPTPPL